MKYSDKLKDPRWQKKRLEVLERDDWACVRCGDESSTLHVHHLTYDQGKEPWEYGLDMLLTLCESCHEHEYETRPVYEKMLLSLLCKNRFLSDDIYSLVDGLLSFTPQNPHIELIASAYGNAFSNPHIQDYLIESVLMEYKKNAAKQGDKT